MSRVHCLECGDPVVVDPRGLCPEGHQVGTVGSRIEQAMGHQAAHPDEPQPWVYGIDPDELESAAGRRSVHAPLGTGTNGADATRVARPVRVPGLPEEGFDDEPADAESLLRELHSLAALDSTLAEERRNGATNGQHRRSPAAPTPAPGSPPPPPPQAATPTPRPPRPDPSAIADAFAELNALDGTKDVTNGVRPAPAVPTPLPASRPSPPPDVEAAETAETAETAEAAEAAVNELSSLFDDPPLFTRAGPGHQADASPAPAVGAEAVRTPTPPTPRPTGIDRARQQDDTAGFELEAMFELAEPPAAAAGAGAAGVAKGAGAAAGAGAAGVAKGAGAAGVAGAAQPGRQSSEQTADQPADQTPEQPTEPVTSRPVPTPAGPGLDLSSFTARGGGGTGKDANRRRRFGR